MNLSLKNREWKDFELGKLFKIFTGGDLIISRIKKGNIPIISHSISNNGIAEWTKPIKRQTLFNHKTTISLADRGNFYAYTQKLNFYIGTRVKALVAKFLPCSPEILNFICLVINKQSVKFSYGNNATGGTEKIKILLPTNSHGEPDYEFMENYMRQKEQEKINAYKNYISKRVSEFENTKKVVPLSEKDWEEFEISKVFKIKAGKRLTKADMKKGKKPFIGATEYNNGITEYVANTNSSEDFNILGVNYNGSVVENFYHPYKALFSDDVKRLSYKEVEGNKHLYLFAKTQILKQKSKYQYGYKFNGTRMNRQKIMLPINENKAPDYEYMENYMKQLELKQLKQYLEYRTIEK